MTKCNPDRIAEFALHLVAINGLSDKGYNAAMRREFPGITNYALRQARLDARVRLAIKQVVKKEKGDDE